MLIQHHYLRKFRKQSGLLQSDIAFLLGLDNHACVSRWENGVHTPGIEVLMLYHLLFGMPIEALFERQRQELSDTIRNKVSQLVAAIQEDPAAQNAAARMSYLSSVFSKLSHSPSL